MIYDTLCKCKQGDTNATLALVGRFDPLLHKYGRKLGTEDGYNDMLLEFLCKLKAIEPKVFIHTDNGTMVSYFAKTIYHSYIKLLREHIRSSPPTVYIDDLPQSVLNTNCLYDQTVTFDIPDGLLTSAEKRTLYYIDALGHTAAEVAHMQNTTRQNVSQTRKRALRKIKNHLESTDQL